MDCLFCNIIEKKIPADIVYEDEYVLVFKDINPVAPVHVLLIPKVHITSVNNITLENSKYISKIFEVIPDVAKKLGVYEKGYRLICNTGHDGGQVVGHLHVHLIGGKDLGSKI